MKLKISLFFIMIGCLINIHHQYNNFTGMSVVIGYFITFAVSLFIFVYTPNKNQIKNYIGKFWVGFKESD